MSHSPKTTPCLLDEGQVLLSQSTITETSSREAPLFSCPLDPQLWLEGPFQGCLDRASWTSRTPRVPRDPSSSLPSLSSRAAWH